MFCFCYVPTLSVLYWVHLCIKCSLDISNFLEEITSLSHSIVFLYFFALISEEGFFSLSLLFFGTLHSNGYIFPFLLWFSLLFFSQWLYDPTLFPFNLQWIFHKITRVLDVKIKSHINNLTALCYIASLWSHCVFTCWILWCVCLISLHLCLHFTKECTFLFSSISPLIVTEMIYNFQCNRSSFQIVLFKFFHFQTLLSIIGENVFF